MGQITAGIGLISGLPIADIVDQLMAIEARPKTVLTNRNTVLQTQQAALADINARLLALKLSGSGLTLATNFNQTTATSSNESVLTVSSGSSAIQGNYALTVRRLVAAQQMISRGFADPDLTPVGGGTFTFESGAARLDSRSLLRNINGGQGLSRGAIRITDRSGATAIVDLSDVVTIRDVTDAINSRLGVSVAASADGDRLKITDLTGQTASNLIVGDVGATATATSLGLAGSSATNELVGSQINTVGRDTVLAVLNDANGVRVKEAVADFRITSAGGPFYDIDLEGTVTLGDVVDRINATGGLVTASFTPDSLGIRLTDSGGGGPTFAVTALNGSDGAADLGILGNDGDSDTQADGRRLLAALNSKLIGNLNGGLGVTTLGTISIQNRLGGPPTNVDLSTSESIVDIIDVINNAATGMTAALNAAGHGLLLTDTTGGSSAIVIADVTGTAAVDLNLDGTHANTDTVNSQSLQFQHITEATRLEQLGVARGKFIITDSSGISATVDLTQGDEQNIGDVLQEINSRGLAITALINDNGDGILIQDDGPGVVALKVEESGSSTAVDLGIFGTAPSAGADLDGSFERSVSFSSGQLVGTTTLVTLNSGQGVDVQSGVDDFSITTRDSSVYNVNLDGATTIDDVITAISTATGGNVTATIGIFGTNLVLTDSTSGPADFRLQTIGNSNAAKDLGILATAVGSSAVISGSTVTEPTTLDDVAQKINDAGIGISAMIVNDGSVGTPYRLSLSADTAGSNGAFIFDDGGLEFGATTLAEAQDAVVFFGASDPASALLVTSKSNQLTSAVPGASIDLLATSSEPVQVTISKDDDAAVKTVKDFVDDFNAVVDRLDQLDSYDAETEHRGLLLGDSAVAQLRQQLYRVVINRNSDLSSAFTSLGQVGITIGSGATLRLDEAKLRAALESNADAVEALFTFKRTETASNGTQTVTAAGIGVRIDQLLVRLTDPQFGPAIVRADAIDQQITLNNRRIEGLDDLLAAKRQRLERQFIAMEQALARLQEQSSALVILQSLAQSTAGLLNQ